MTLPKANGPLTLGMSARHHLPPFGETVTRAQSGPLSLTLEAEAGSYPRRAETGIMSLILQPNNWEERGGWSRIVEEK